MTGPRIQPYLAQPKCFNRVTRGKKKFRLAVDGNAKARPPSDNVFYFQPTLFGRSIKKNIIYGLEGTDREPSDEEVEEAARLSNASGFIEVSTDRLVTMWNII